MKPKIEHPHIFISYAWGTDENQQKVIEFATSLVQCGIEVELDKWSLKEGNDTYAYMEQMVNNPKITNVLILLDKNYAEKADARKGGVGTETQILSPEIYEKVKQDKFIPVVFKRGSNGEIFKPSFLKGLLHFDLSIDEKYSAEFQRLVKRLFGIEVYEKPELGTPPDWITQNEQPINQRIAFTKILNSKNDKEKQYEIKLAFKEIEKSIIDNAKSLSLNNDNYIDSYKTLQVFRDKALSLIEMCIWFDKIDVEIASFLEGLKNIRLDSGSNNDIKDTLVHEIFIYSVALLFKTQNYAALGYILNKTYFPNSSYDEPTSFNHFYMHNQTLDNAVSKRDKTQYHCGTAHLWMQTININYVSRDDFILADVLLYNIAVFGKNYGYHWLWFPVSYVYDPSNSLLSGIGRRMASKECVDSLRVVFGYDDSLSFIEAIKTKSEKADEQGKYRYPGAWREAPLLIDFIKSEDIGKYN